MAFDRTNPTDLAALNTEMFTDPLGLGYQPENTDYSLNLINATNASYSVTKDFISSKDIRSATTYDAYNNILADEQEWLRWMTGSGGEGENDVKVTADLKTQLTGPDAASIWAAANRTEMNAAMLALTDVPGSRAEVLFGYGTLISKDDWIAAKVYS